MTQGYRQPREVSDRFWEKVLRSGDCWLWTGAKGPRGYGHFMMGSRTDGSRKILAAHRVSYWLTHGVWSTTDRHLHHLCENPSCVRPDHLEIVSQREHIYRHDGPTARNGRLTNCRKCGRPLSGENLIVERSGGRRCKSCRHRWMLVSSRERRRKQRENRPPSEHESQLVTRHERIRELLSQGMRGAEIARLTGESRATISRIKNNRNAKMWLPSARNVSDAGRTLAKARKPPPEVTEAIDTLNRFGKGKT